MAVITINPTSNTTPDAGQGGNAVTGATNTGHDLTTVNAPGSVLQTKSCIWTTFTTIPGQIKSITLKFGWSEDGVLNFGTGSASNSFRVQYSVNGGGAFTTIFDHIDVTSPTTSSSQVAIAIPQDITQIQVRDRLTAVATVDPSDSASITASVSNIRLEIETADGLVVMM